MAVSDSLIAPECWYHIIQRGHLRQAVFFDDADRAFYLDLLKRHSARFHVRIGGYCLMANHVHLVAAPQRGHALALSLARIRQDYERWYNLRQQRTGPVWDGRICSSLLDEAHTWEVLRYVELNPVRAALRTQAAAWPWSSAAAHTAGGDGTGVLDFRHWRTRWSPETWRRALEQEPADSGIGERIHSATEAGLPMGREILLYAMEQRLGRYPRPQRRGPQPERSAESQERLAGVV